MAIPLMQNNSPAAGYIAWDAFTIQLNGVAYGVPAGNSDQRWIWWEYNGGTPLLNAGADVPDTLTDDDLVLFANKNGISVRVQSTSFIDGELLVDGSVFAQALHANIISSEHIVTAGLDAGVIRFGVMSGDRIETNTLAGDKILANTIGVSKLIVSDFNNYVADGDLYDPTLSNWTGATRTDVAGDVSYIEWATLASGNSHIVNLNSFEVKPGDQFYFECEVSTPASNTVSANVVAALQTKDGDNATVTWPQLPAKPLAPGTAWAPYSGVITIPAGNSVRAFFNPFTNSGGTAGQVVRMRKVWLQKKANGNLIVDGSINSTHVVTQGLDAGVIKFGTMSGDRITANTINSGHVVTTGLDAGVVKFGTMSGDRIAANTISSGHVVTSGLDAGIVKFGTMSGARITVGTLDGDRIIANTLDANAIIANTMTADLLTANNALIDALQVSDLSTTTLNSVNIEGGTIAIATVGAATFNQSFGGTALPGGWSHQQTFSDPTLPVSVSVGTAASGGSDNGVALKVSSTTTDYTTSQLGYTEGYIASAASASVDVDITARYWVNSAADSAEDYRLYFRLSGGTPGSGTEDCLYFDMSESGDPGIYQVVDGSDPSLLGTFPVTMTASTWYNVHIKAVAGQISFAVWKNGTTEPKPKVYQVANVMNPGTVGIWYYLTRFMTLPNGKDLQVDYINTKTLSTGFTVNPDGVAQVKTADVTNLTVDNINGRAFKKFDFGIRTQSTGSTGYINIAHTMGVVPEFAAAFQSSFYGQNWSFIYDDGGSTSTYARFLVKDHNNTAVTSQSLTYTFFTIA